MNEIPAKLDFISELIALTTYGNTRNLLVTAVEVSGPLDEDAIQLAAKRALGKFPQVMSRLKEVKIKGRYHLVWEDSRDWPLPVLFSTVDETDPSRSVVDVLVDRLRPRLDRDWNLFEEIPVEFHVLRLPPDRYLLVSVCHHVASDAETASEFGKEVLAQYHEITAGGRPEWSCEARALSTSGKRAVEMKAAGWKDFFYDAHNTGVQLFRKPALPKGSGSRSDKDQHHVHRWLSESDSANLAARAAANRLSLVDLLSASATLAVDQWNAAGNMPLGRQTAAVTVNARGRWQGSEAPNMGTVMFMESMPSQRKNAAEFARSLGLNRIRQFRQQQDLKLMRSMETLVNSLRIFPFRIRRRIVHFVVGLHNYSAAITMLGVVWPKMTDGKPMGDTGVTTSGELTVDNVYGIAYKLQSSTKVLLLAYVFKSRLHLVLACSGSLFTRHEAEAFMDLIMKKLHSGELTPRAVRTRPHPAARRLQAPSTFSNTPLEGSGAS